MELSNRNKFHTMSHVFVVLYIAATTRLVNTAVIGSSNGCNFPAIINFGDSNSDTGGFAAAFIQPPPPYGITYFNRPVGRFSDGRLIIDFIAQSFGLPLLSAYLNSLGANYSNGANFATASSTIRIPRTVLPNLGGRSPFTLTVQTIEFTQFKPRTQLISQQGGAFASSVPKQEYFSNALYTIDIGQNDLADGIFGGSTVQQLNDSVPQIIDSFSTNVRGLYILGARYFWIHNTGPIGCLPYILATFPLSQRDANGCAKQYNDVAQYFNQKLKEAVVQLRIDLPLAAITLVDIYTVKYSLFTNPLTSGFVLPLFTCCGFGGGLYNYNSTAGCGQTINVNGTQITVGSCENRPIRVIWDGIHYTEAANKYIFDKISTGAFSDPPIPLNMTCMSNITST